MSTISKSIGSAPFNLLSSYIVSLLFQLLVDSCYWLPGTNTPRTGKSYETHTLLGRLLRPTTIAPSPVQPAVNIYYHVIIIIIN